MLLPVAQNQVAAEASGIQGRYMLRIPRKHSLRTESQMPDRNSDNTTVLVVIEPPAKLEMLAALEALFPASRFVPVAVLRDALDDETSSVLIILDEPVLSLATALSVGAPSRLAVADWLAHHETLLDTQRRNQKRVTLVGSAMFEDAGASAEVWARVAQRLGTNVSGALPNAVPGSDVAPPYRIAAHHLVLANQAVSTLSESLLSNMVTTGNTSSDPVLDLVEACHAAEKSWETEQQLRTQIALLDAESEKLSEELRQAWTVKDDLHSRLAEQSLLRASNDALKARLAHVRGQSDRRIALLGHQVLADAKRLRCVHECLNCKTDDSRASNTT